MNSITTILLAMANTLYLDCVGGVAGDMLLAALIVAGAPLEAVQAGLPPVEGLRLDVERVQRCGVDATMLSVTCPPQHAHRKLHDVRAYSSTPPTCRPARARACHIPASRAGGGPGARRACQRGDL